MFFPRPGIRLVGRYQNDTRSQVGADAQITVKQLIPRLGLDADPGRFGEQRVQALAKNFWPARRVEVVYDHEPAFPERLDKAVVKR